MASAYRGAKDNQGAVERSRAFVNDNRRYQANMLPASPLPSGLGKVIGGKYIDPSRNWRGRWTQQDSERDERWARWFKIKQNAANGTKMLDFNAVNSWLDDKAVQQKHLDYMSFSAALVDPRDPSTVRKAYSIVPELKEVTDRNFDEEAKKQFFIYYIIQQGEVRTPEEHRFLYAMLDPRFVLPTKALWDPNGVFLEEAGATQNSKIDAGLFNRYVWSFNNKSIDAKTGYDLLDNARAYSGPGAVPAEALETLNGYPGATREQLSAKTLIIKYVMPAMRDADIKDVASWVVMMMFNMSLGSESQFPTPFDPFNRDAGILNTQLSDDMNKGGLDAKSMRTQPLPADASAAVSQANNNVR